jgi:hypothetical protein
MNGAGPLPACASFESIWHGMHLADDMTSSILVRFPGYQIDAATMAIIAFECT